jgi:SPP1 gp7 family putative phage head morphogenesis protein
MSANGYLVDALTRHQLFIQRLASGQVKKSLPILRRMAKEIRAALLNHDLTSFQAARLTALQFEIDAITQSAGLALESQTMPAMRDFAAYESQFTQRMLQGAVAVELAGISTAALARGIESTPMQLISGQRTIVTTLSGAFDTFAAGASREVMTAVQSGITRGLTTKEIASEVFGMVSTRTRQQAETVVRTAANLTGSVARNATYRANSDVLKGEEYSAVLDGRTTITCASLDGKIYPVGEGPIPPLHYGCVLPSSRVLPVGRINYVTKRPFDGEMVRITSLGNRVLTVTANHPVMTDSGFVSANLIKQGDNLVCCLSSNEPVAGSYDDEMKSSIEDAFDSLSGSSKMLSCPVPAAPEDFHGDVSKCEIGVVLVDVELADSFVSTFAHKYVEYFLKMRASGALGDKSGCGGFGNFVGGFFATSRCGVSFTGERHARFMARIIHSGLLLLASVPGLSSVSNKELVDNAGASANAPCYSGAPRSEVEHGENAFGVKVEVERASKLNSSLICEPVNDASTDASFLADFRRLESRIQKLDTVVKVELISFSGHVFNLMTDDGVYSADGIITHNCRSVRVPVVADEFAALREGATRASMTGPVSSQTTYNSWLGRQSPEFQDEVLGPERAQLFRSGGLSLDKFTDDAGKVYTLDELKAREGLTL